MNYVGLGRYEESQVDTPIMPGFRDGDRIAIITDGGRTNGILSAASVAGISFSCERGFRFVPWTAIRSVNLTPEGYGEKA